MHRKMNEKQLSKYQVGEMVWFARCAFLPIKKPCPICYGNKKVELILGNGDSVILPCEYCGKGYEAPTGLIEEYEYVIEPECVVITSITLEMTNLGVKAEYHSCSRYYEEDLLFSSKEEAAIKGKELKAVLEHEQNTRIEYLKKSKSASFAWNAGYHLREAKRSRADVERHEQKAFLCKARSKKEKMK